MASLAIVASTPGLAHTAWLSLRGQRPTTIMMGEPGQLVASSRMQPRILPSADCIDPSILRDAVGDRRALPVGERAHVRLLDAGIPCLGHDDAVLLRRMGDKQAHPELAAECGFQVPPLVQEGEGPVLEKPRWGYGGLGIRQWTPGMPRRADTVLQRFIDGDDVDVSLVAHAGRVVACTAERPVDTNMRVYCREPAAEAAAQALVEATGYTGLLHLDMRVDADGAWIVDINPRLWATHWMAASMGMDFIQAHLDAEAGRPVRFKRRTGVFAPPWRLHHAIRHGRPHLMAPLRAAWVRRADPGVARMLRHEKRAPRHGALPWPGAF